MAFVFYSLQVVFLFLAIFFSALVFLSPGFSLFCAVGASCLCILLVYRKIIDATPSFLRTFVAALSAGGATLIFWHHCAHVSPSLWLVVLVLFFLFVTVVWLASSLQSTALRLAVPVMRHKTPISVLFSCVIALSLFVLQACKYASFKSEMWDIGCFAQSFANTLQGNFFQTTWQFTERNICGFGSHSEAIFLAIVPIFALFPHPLTLIAVQSILIGFSLGAFYLLARDTTGSCAAALVFMICFGLYPPLYLGGLYDFHGELLAVPFLVLLIRQSVQNKFGWSMLWLVCALACKEYCALVTGMWGIYCWAGRKNIRLGAAILLISVLWFFGALATQNIIRPDDLPSQFTLAYAQWGGSFVAIVKNVICNPGHAVAFVMSQKNIENMLLLVFPTAGLFLFCPWMILVCSVDFLRNVMTGNMSIETQRIIPIVPFVWYGTVQGYLRLCKNATAKMRVRLLALILFSGVIASMLYSETPWSQRFYRGLGNKYAISPSDRAAMSRLSAIPQKAIVSAGPNIYPHLFRHASIYSFPYIGSAHPAEYIVIDTSNLLPGSQAVLGDILASGKYRKDWQNGKYEIIIRQSSHGKQDSEGAL
jgi:uncharacterized membrane protein